MLCKFILKSMPFWYLSFVWSIGFDSNISKAFVLFYFVLVIDRSLLLEINQNWIKEMTEKSSGKPSTMWSNKPVPMKLFGAWEIDKTPSNCIPRYSLGFSSIKQILYCCCFESYFWHLILSMLLIIITNRTLLKLIKY